MRRKLLGCLAVIVSLLCCPASALAQDASRVYDARLEGYANNVTLTGSSTALMWLLLIVLAAICVGVLFMNAKRTHLD